MIDDELVQDGLGGTRLTRDNLAGNDLVAPIVERALQLLVHTFGDDALVINPRAWGVLIAPGVQIPTHDHCNQTYTAIYYLTDGVDLTIEGERVVVEPHRLVAFSGNDKHWTEKHTEGDRYSVAMAFG